MTREKLEEIFNKTNSKWEGDNFVKGIMILVKYFNIEKEYIVKWAGHDQVSTKSIDKLIDAGLTEEDATNLALLNWHIDEETDSLNCFI